jgi:hypothetical protein
MRASRPPNVAPMTPPGPIAAMTRPMVGVDAQVAREVQQHDREQRVIEEVNRCRAAAQRAQQRLPQHDAQAFGDLGAHVAPGR